VGEVMMGTTLREAIDLIGGGARPGRTIKAVMSGVSNALVPAELLDTPMTYEDMAAIGSGLGSAGLIVFDDTDDLVAVAAGASRFLAVESCGQCSPCKQDGLTIADALERLCQNDAAESDVTLIEKRLRTVPDGARCYLATQQQVVVSSVVERFPAEIEAHVRRRAQVVEPLLIAELVDIADDHAVLDERHRDKQPDWSYGPEWSGQTPADLANDHQVDPALGR